MKFILLLALSGFIASGAGAQEKDATGLLGTWVGRWERGSDHKLIVEKVEGTTAIFVYRVREAALSEDTTRARRYKGVIVNGVLYGRFDNGAQLTYELSADGKTLVGHYARDGRTMRGVFAHPEPPAK